MTTLTLTQVMPPARLKPRHRARSVWPQRLLWAGIALIVFAGSLMLTGAAYQIWGGSAAVASHQVQVDSALDQQWANLGSAPSSSAELPPPAGDYLARLYIPRLNLHWGVVEGVDLSDIRYGPGHYTGTAMPGAVGNFAMAGHRDPGIWADLDQVKQGDVIVVETRSRWFIYVVSSVRIVPDGPAAWDEVAPIPPGFHGKQRLISLTTCHPRWDNYERLIVHGVLDRSVPMTAARTRPPELTP